MNRLLPLLGVGLFVQIVGGCATGDAVRADDFDVLVPVPVPIYSENDGVPATIIDALLAYYGIAQESGWEQSAAGRLQAEVGAEDLRSYLEATGLDAASFRGDPGETPIGLRYHLTRGRPVLALLTMPGGEARWALVVGYSNSRKIFAVQGPSGRLDALPEESLRHCWGRGGNVCVLATPRN